MTKRCTGTLTGHTGEVYSVVEIAHGRVVSGSKDDTIKCWDMSREACILTLQGHRERVTSVCPMADERLIGSASADATVRIWDTRSAACKLTLSGHGKQRDDDVGKTYAGWVRSVIQLTDGRICSGGDDTTVKIWDMRTGTCQQTLEGHTDWVTSVVQLADGRICSGSFDETVKLWDAHPGACVHTLMEPKTRPTLIKKFIPFEHRSHEDSEQVIEVCGKKYTVVEEIEKLTGADTRIGQNWVNAVIQLADGRICSANRRNTVKIWNPKTQTCDATWVGHGDWVTSVSQLTNGQICSGSRDKTVKVWDVSTGECVMNLSGHHACVNSVIQMTDGRICSGSSDQTVKLWE